MSHDAYTAEEKRFVSKLICDYDSLWIPFGTLGIAAAIHGSNTYIFAEFINDCPCSTAAVSLNIVIVVSISIDFTFNCGDRFRENFLVLPVDN